MKSTIKTAVTVAVVMLLTSASLKSFSQTSKFGISLNSLTTNFNYGKSNGTLQSYKKNYQGLQAGFSYQVGVTSAFSIVPEIYFARKGGILKDNNPLTVNKSTVKLYSIEMPLLARVDVNKLYLNAGPYTGYMLSGRIKTEGTSVSPAKTTKLSFGSSGNDFKRWDFGVLAGAGYNFTTKKKILTLDARYGYGLVNISKDVQRYNRMLNISLVVSKIAKKKNLDNKANRSITGRL